MTIVYRKNLNRPMSWEELDGNFEEVERIGVQSQQYANNASTSAAASASSASFAQQQVIVASGEADRAESEADRAAAIAAEIDGGFGGQYRNLSVNVSGIGYQGTITADRLVVESSEFKTKLLRNVNVAFDGSGVGINGLDAGSISAGNWYYIYVIHNPTTDSVASLISLSSTAPTLPNGYTRKVRVGSAKVQAAASTFFPSIKRGVRCYMKSTNGTSYNLAVNNGSATTWTPFSVATFVPPTAVGVMAYFWASTLSNMIYVGTRSADYQEQTAKSYGGNAALVYFETYDSPQQLSYLISGGGAGSIAVSGYEEPLE